jgi:hypothetical protein
MSEVLTISDAQIEKIIAAINSSHESWWPVLSVFVSALLAMLVGIAIDYLKRYWEAKQRERETQKSEIQQINVTIEGMGFNIELLLHIVAQHILPHYGDSDRAYADLQIASTNGQQMTVFAQSLHTYSQLMMICPEPNFQQFRFLNDLKFVVEKEPTLLKRAGWLDSCAKELNSIISSRNENIRNANSFLMQTGGQFNFHQIGSVLQMQLAVAKAECVTASQLFDVLLDVENALERVNATYRVKAKKTKLTPPAELQQFRDQLSKIVTKIPFPSMSEKS